MVKEIKTSSGFVCGIDDDIRDDYEFIEMVADAYSESATGRMRTIELNRYILGPEQYDALKEHCRKENGRVSMAQMETEIREILQLLPDAKKN